MKSYLIALPGLLSNPLVHGPQVVELMGQVLNPLILDVDQSFNAVNLK
jgi:hypothetical protein